MEELSVHKCGGDWMYCDGHCAGCYKNETRASDVVEVVRCRDCQLATFRQLSEIGEKIFSCTVSGRIHGEDFYCAYGQRKEQC